MATRSVDRRRRIKAVGTGIDDTIDKDHPGASDTVAHPLPVTSDQLRCNCSKQQDPSAGWSRLTHKALDSLKTLCYPLSTLPWDLGAKRSSRSGKLAPWFSG